MRRRLRGQMNSLKPVIKSRIVSRRDSSRTILKQKIRKIVEKTRMSMEILVTKSLLKVPRNLSKVLKLLRKVPK
jgi:hypothetical protein